MKEPILILHGWGLRGGTYAALKKIFEQNGHKVYAPDFPGFGETPLPKPSLTLGDYVTFLKEYYKKHNIHKAILIGHSFGGRIAVLYVTKYPQTVSKLVLTGSPVIKTPLSFKKKALSLVSKVGHTIVPKKLEKYARKILYYMLGEWDYYKSGHLKKTLVNILEENVTNYVSRISVPTLILWGEKDTFVALSVGREIAKRVRNASLVVIKGATHKLPYENPEVFAGEVLKFIR